MQKKKRKHDDNVQKVTGEDPVPVSNESNKKKKAKKGQPPSQLPPTECITGSNRIEPPKNPGRRNTFDVAKTGEWPWAVEEALGNKDRANKMTHSTEQKTPININDQDHWKGTGKDGTSKAVMQDGDQEEFVLPTKEVPPDADEAEILAALRDITLECKECGNGFIFTARQQKWFVQTGLENFPARCPDCRREKQEFFAGAPGGSSCFKCGQKGHWAKDCSNEATETASKCYRCGEQGHFSRECPNNVPSTTWDDTKWRQPAHSSASKTWKQSTQPQVPKTWQQPTQPQERCVNCGKGGHRAFDCPRPARKESVCRDFAEGLCTRGSTCKFVHEFRLKGPS